VVGKLVKHLGSLRGKTVALLGLAFKPNTNDMREAPSLVLAFRLMAEGATVRGWDRVALEEARAMLPSVEVTGRLLDALKDADAAVIVTEWSELAGLLTPELRDAMRKPLIVDGRNLLDPSEARAAGFVYESIGRAAHDLDELPETEEPETKLHQ
jgi:UDPglucose 6-dehydrogenase